ncbi:alkyl sulfatase C-terminal domain-containing protein [Nocardia sp. NPDC057353]|uniref:alkyl sulfatase C-terminal domain-containing protein n=1 Tax=Nocardia sp. NPDC057353 TaxID=3346104 RepID=UPI00363BC7D3
MATAEHVETDFADADGDFVGTDGHGLFEVISGIYQVRRFDISTMTLIEGATGVIVLDPRTGAETAAALALYRRHRGARPVTAVIHTHPPADHACVVDPDIRVPIVAPEHSRAGLFAPTAEIRATGEAATYDGVEFVFQLTPGTGAPAAMNVHLPGHRALCLTRRGERVRDPRTRSRHLAEAIELFAGESEVLFAAHHRPIRGRERIAGYLRAQRDLYAYLHNQSARLMNAHPTDARTVTQLFDTVAVRLVPERAGEQRLSIHWVVTDLAEHYRMELGNAVLVHFPTRRDDPADLTVELTHAQLRTALTTGDLGSARCCGDPAVLRRVLAMTDAPDPRFAVGTP